MKVFISYSWDNEEHEKWIVSLANELRNYGIEANCDHFLKVNNINKMMVEEIKNSDKIIVVVTKGYFNKANEFKGGVGFESELILDYVKNYPEKIVVIKREECDMPFHLKGFYYINLINPTEEKVEELVRVIKNIPKYEAVEVAEKKIVSTIKVSGLFNKSEKDKKDFDILEFNLPSKVNNKKNNYSIFEELEYIKPEVPTLDTLNSNQETAEDYSEKAKILDDVFKSFKIGAKVAAITVGVSIVRFEIQLLKGVSINQLLKIEKDLEIALASNGHIRIEHILGTNLIGIEMPVFSKNLTNTDGIFNSDEFLARSKLSFILGKDISGKDIIKDLTKLPHLLIGGSTGSGKSNFLNIIITSIITKASPEDVKLILIDPKVVEFDIYNELPHLLTSKVIVNMENAILVLEWVAEEIERRFELFSKSRCKDIVEYNNLIEKLPYIVIIIDELADLMAFKKKELENIVVKIAQLSRAAGIHMVVATQRPNVNVLSGLVKANFSSRAAFKVASIWDSQTILDRKGAEKLSGFGDMLFLSADMSQPVRIQCPYISLDEIKNIIKKSKTHLNSRLKSSAKNPITENSLSMFLENRQESKIKNIIEDGIIEDDSLLLDVLKFLIEKNQISISLIQRKFKLGFARAAKIVDCLEQRGFISSFGNGPRQILISTEEFNKKFGALKE